MTKNPVGDGQSAEPEPFYIHGTSSMEWARLAAMNDAINDACLAELRLTGNQRILDVGSGLGQFSRAMARAAGVASLVVGVERDESQIAEAQRLAAESAEGDWVDFRLGDAARLPLSEVERGTFDIVHTRFLLEHVRDPLAVVRQMVAAVRPGGRIVLADDDHDLLRLWPEPRDVNEAWHAYIQTYERNGCDPFVGRKMVQLLHQAGAVPTRNTFVFFAACRGHVLFPAFVENLIGVLRGARETVAGLGLLNPVQYDRALDHLRVWADRPDAAFWYPICWAEGVRPG